MPDWITHIAVAWTICMILGLKYKQFNASNTMIVLVGALLPDIYKLYLLNPHLLQYILIPIHIPTGSFIIAGMISLFFKEKKMTVTTENGTHETDCFINTIAVGRRFAGGFFLTPKAIANDGLLDVCIGLIIS